MFKFREKYKNLIKENISLKEEITNLTQKEEENREEIKEEIHIVAYSVDMSKCDNIKVRSKNSSFQVLFYNGTVLVEETWLNGFEKIEVFEWVEKLKTKLGSNCVAGLNTDRTFFIEAK